MPPGTEQAAQNAIDSAGWVGYLAFGLGLGFVAFVLLAIRQLWNDHRKLNEWVRDDMAAALNSIALAFGKFARSRPCLHDSDSIMEQVLNGDDDEELDEYEKKAKAYLKKVMARRRKQLDERRLERSEVANE